MTQKFSQYEREKERQEQERQEQEQGKKKKDGKTVVRASYGMFYDHPLLGLAFDSDVADGSQAPQLVLTPGAPGGCTASLSNLNATNAFQGLLGCLPAAFDYLANQQRFNPAPNAPSIFVGQAFLNPAAPMPLSEVTDASPRWIVRRPG